MWLRDHRDTEAWTPRGGRSGGRMERGMGMGGEGRRRDSGFWRRERGFGGFRESGPAGTNQPGLRTGEGGESQDIEPF